MGANMRSFGMRRHQIVWPLRRVFRFRYLKKDWRAVPTDRRGKSPTSMPRRVPSQLHDDRIIGWFKFFTHAP
jgi:hypothetical protein